MWASRHVCFTGVWVGVMETHKSLHTASELTWPAVSVYLAFIRHLRRKRVGWLGSVTLKCTL